MRKLIIFALVCYSIQDLRNEGCRALCTRDGYSSGHANKSGCVCEDIKEKYSEYITRSANIGPSPVAPFIPESKVRSKSFTVEIPQDSFSEFDF